MLHELLSPIQKSKMERGENMKPSIFHGNRAKCVDCSGAKFKRVQLSEFENLMPKCINCNGWPNLFRVIFQLPVIESDEFKDIHRTKNEKNESLTKASRADAYCEYIRKAISLSGGQIDPRELGTKEERALFLVKNCAKSYLEFHAKRLSVKSGKITPGGLSKKERIMRLYIIPLFGEYTIKDVTPPVIKNKISKADLNDSVKTELLKELSPFFKWACDESLLIAPPLLPKKPTEKTFKAQDFYTLEERNLVISNIKRRDLQIAIIIKALYTRRRCEILCLRWGDIDFKNRMIHFSRHISYGKKKSDDREIEGLKSSPGKSLKYTLASAIIPMLIEMTPSLDKGQLIFSSKRGEYLGQNSLYDAWTNSAKELIKQEKLNKLVDLHRGVRNSTLTGLHESGVTFELLGELYGGDMTTLKKHYALKKQQNIGGLLEDLGLFATLKNF